MNENITKNRYDYEEDEDIELTEDYGMILKKSESNKLWARARGKCSICKCDLFKKKYSDTNIGVECHICSEKPDVPSKEFSRYDPNLTSEKRDKSYNNAILLCRNCHAIIDDPKNTQYTIEELHMIKEKHEVDVETDPEVIKERDERRKQLHGWIQEHNKDLIDNVFKPWYIQKFLFNWYDLPEKNVDIFKEFLQNRLGIKCIETAKTEKIDAKTIRVFYDKVKIPSNSNDKTYLSINLNDDKTKVSVEIYNGRTEEFIAKAENGKLNIYEINSINKKEEALALEHLKKYTDLWKLWEDKKTLQDVISREETAINEYILNKLEQSVLLNFKRGYSSTDDLIVMFIYKTVERFSNMGGVPDNYKLYPQNIRGVGINIIFNKTDEEISEQDENFRKETEIIIKDKNLNERIKKVVNSKVHLTKKTNEFERGIEKEVYGFEKKHNLLKGTCDICKKWHEELKSLK